MVNHSKLIFFQKNVDCSLLALQPGIQKIHFNEEFFTIAKMIRNWMSSFFDFFHNSGVKEQCQAKLRFGLEYRLKHSAYQIRCNTADFVENIGLQLSGRTHCFLPGKFFLTVRQSKSPNKQWPNSTESWQQSFGGTFVTSFRTEAAKYIWQFVLMLESGNPSSGKQNVKTKWRRKGYYLTTNGRILQFFVINMPRFVNFKSVRTEICKNCSCVIVSLMGILVYSLIVPVIFSHRFF